MDRDSLGWVDAAEEWLDDVGVAFLEPDSLSEAWLDAYEPELDDGWDELPLEARKPIENFKKTVRVRKVPDSAFRSVESMYDYSVRLGDEAAASFRQAWVSDAYGELTSAQRARILRYRFAPAVTAAWDSGAAVAREVLTGVLVERGIVSRAPATLVMPSFYRLKGVIAKTVGFDVSGGDYRLGWETLEGGSKNVVDLAARQSLLQVSELVNELTGDPLFGRRVLQSSTACDFCKQLALEGFSVDVSRSSREFLEFHDNCRCRVELI